MDASSRNKQLERLLKASSIAVVGATDDLRKPGGRVLNSLVLNGFEGEIVPVNPGRREVQGIPAVPNLRAIGRPVDLVILAVAASEVEAQIRDAIALGTGGAVVFASGYAEADAAGADAQHALAALVRDAGFPVIGPNCLGIMDGNNRMLASSTVVMEGRLLPPGSYAFVTQSGAIGTYWLDMALKAGLGVSSWISTGNEADIDLAACLRYLVEDDRTEVIGLYIEGVRDGRAFREAAREAFRRRKPILALKSGRSRAGASAAASHTGALAGEDAAYGALFDQFNIARVDSLTEMADLAQLLVSQPLRAGRNVCIVSVSGGAGVLMTDAAVAAGLSLPEFQTEEKAALRAILPPFVSPQNPVDLTAQIVMQKTLLRETLRICGNSPSFDAILLFMGGLGQIADELADALIEELPRDKPCAIVWQAAPAAAERVKSRGIPVFGEIPDAVNAMAALLRMSGRWDGPSPPAAETHPRAGQDGVFLIEHAGKELLVEGAGLRRPAGFISPGPDDIRARAAGLKAPLVAKLQSPQMLHKSGAGGIALKLADSAAAAEAADRMLAQAEASGLSCAGILVEEMIAFDHEFIVGLRSDPVFGPMLVLGRGGVAVELEPDVARAYLPLGRAEIEALIRSLRCAPLLDGFRGGPPCDIPALAAAVERLADFYRRTPAIDEIEINPLVVDRNGTAYALDALVRTSAPATPEPALVAAE